MSRSKWIHVEEPIEDPALRRETAEFGMWLFLCTEMLFFGAVLLGYSVYRYKYPDAFEAGSHLLNMPLGAVNTAVLLTSSLAMAYAVKNARVDRAWPTSLWLLATAVLGAAFLGIKGVEYFHDFKEHLIPGPGFHFDGPLALQVELFFFLYFAMTALHGVHMIIGIALVGGLAYRVWRHRSPLALGSSVEVIGLYWHFVDLVWVFLFPLLYLIGVRHG